MSGEKDVLTTNLRVEELDLGFFTPRLQFDPKYIEELAEDIQNNGQQKPIICRLHPEKPNVYQVIDGEHRVRAVRKLGRSLIRAEVKTLTDEEAMFLALRINQLHGKRLEPLEEALHIKKMMEKQKLSQQQIATKFRRTQAWVSERLNLVTRLSPKVQEKVIAQAIKSKHAYEISKLPEDEQEKVAEFVSKEKPSVKETKFLIELVKEQPSKAKELLEKDKDHLRAEMKHGEVIETAKRLE
jgi:ParB family chromosome partitioning protein